MYYREYLDRIDSEGWSDDLLALDMETTGLNPRTADILSFGSVVISGDTILPDSEHHHFFHSLEASDDNTAIHELFAHTTESLVEEYLPLILGQVANRRLLGHYVSFDIALINQQLHKVGLPKLRNPSIDTLELALHKDGIRDYRYAHKEDYTLYALCQRYGIEVEYTHDALHDAYLTGLVYLHL